MTSSPVRRAIVPCGGKGTRMLSITGGVAKELLPIAGEPVLAHVLRECAQSGIARVLVVISPDKQSIAEYLTTIAGAAGMPAVEIGVQTRPKGLADAIRVGRDFTGDEPFVVALPDNLFVDGPLPAVAQVIDTFGRTGKNVVGLTEITRDIAGARGPTPIYPGTRAGDDFLIDAIPGKGAHDATFSLGAAESAMTGVGRYVFTAAAYRIIESVERTLEPGMELDDIPVMQAMLAEGTLLGCVLQGTFLDVGLPTGYREAAQRTRL